MIFDGAITGVQDPQCKTCANADICKFTGMSEDLEKQLSDIADLASTPYTTRKLYLLEGDPREKV